ncbi:MAG: DUF2461 domain-containing protein [Blastocatellia bacterium]
MAKELQFTPRLFEFLRELKANNNKEWFDANKQRYLDDVRDPLLAVIAALGPRLIEISPFLVTDPKRVVFRIYRDIRFSQDKKPYKTHASAFFHHQSGKDGPGLYLHLEPDGCFFGAGLYHPDPKTRAKITDTIAAKPDAWGAIVNHNDFKKVCRMEGDSLAKLPKQYDPQHPYATDLQRKDFIVAAYFTEKQACARDFPDRIARLCHISAPYVGFVARAAGMKW